MTTPRFIIADPAIEGQGWTHIFEENGRTFERQVRFVFDRERDCLHCADIRHGRKFQEASCDEIAELEDSLKNANPDAIDNPAGWGLGESDEWLPEWAPRIEDEEPALFIDGML